MTIQCNTTIHSSETVNLNFSHSSVYRRLIFFFNVFSHLLFSMRRSLTYNNLHLIMVTCRRRNVMFLSRYFLLMDVYIQERSGQSNCTRSLTHSLTRF